MKYFKYEEFDSPDEPGSGKKYMNLNFLVLLDNLRGKCGFPFIINSGYRTPKHNKKVGGKPDSAHLDGYAADIRCTESWKRKEIIENALSYGINRIGIAKTFIHLDMGPDKPQNVIWVY